MGSRLPGGHGALARPDRRRRRRRDYAEQGGARIYHLRSDSLFDFRPRLGAPSAACASSVTSELEDVLDVLVQGSDERPRARCGAASARGRLRRHPRARARDRCDEDEPTDGGDRLRRRASASTRTSRCRRSSSGCGRATTCRTSPSPTRSRRRTRSSGTSPALDYAAKVLDVEVIHGVERPRPLPRPAAAGSRTSRDVVARDRASRATARSSRTSRTCSRTRTRSCRQYLALTERRSLDVYERIKRDEHVPDLSSAATFLDGDARLRRS